MESSIEPHAQLLNDSGLQMGDLASVFIGGGTPSLWGSQGAEFLQNFFDKLKIKPKKDCEFTIEVNPGGWSEADLLAFENVGANRFSLGIQSFNQKFIKHLDRIHSLSDVKDTLQFFNKRQLNFSVDFMLGLPFSERDKRDVIKELEEVLKFEPNHFSLYILTVKDNYTHHAFLPSDEWIEKEYLDVSRFLNAHGYDHYEVSNFAKPGFESSHNLAYWESESVAAFGPSATGLLSAAKTRYKWNPHQVKFELEKLNDEEFKLEEFYMKFRTNRGLNFDSFFSTEDLAKVEELVQLWIDQNLAQKDQQGFLRLTPKGFFSMDNLINQLFSHTSSL